jgi:hypothetical protein
MHKHAIKALIRYLTVLALLIPLVVARNGTAPELMGARQVVETRSALQTGDTLAFHVTGRMPIKQPAPNRLAVADLDVTSLVTGEKVGKLTWDLTCLGAVPYPCGNYDVVATFELPGGTLVNKAKAGAIQDPSHPDSFLVGTHPDGKTIEGTGAYAGRTGKIHHSGFHICKECPGFATFDDFWLIELDPK